MDKRLILSVLLAVLSWQFIPTYAQATSNLTTDSNTTTVAPDTNIPTVTSANNATTVAPDTNIPMVISANNATTVAPDTNIPMVTLANNATTVAPDTNIPMVTLANNATTVAPDTNIPMVTSANNATTVAPTIKTTLALVIIPPIVESISRVNCSSSKLCVDKPSKCDPASGDCYFLSAKKRSNQTYNFELSGETEGYIAARLSTDTNLNNIELAYICANHSGQVRFFTGSFNNLEPTGKDVNKAFIGLELKVIEMQGSVSSSKIQCTFTADLPDTEKRAASYAMGIFTGPYNSSTGKLGLSKSKTQTAVVVDLSDPTASLIDKLAVGSAGHHVFDGFHGRVKRLMSTVLEENRKVPIEDRRLLCKVFLSFVGFLLY